MEAHYNFPLPLKLKSNRPRMNAPHIPAIPYRHFFNRLGTRPKPPVSRLRQEQLHMLGYMNLDNIGEDKPKKRKK